MIILGEHLGDFWNWFLLGLGSMIEGNNKIEKCAAVVAHYAYLFTSLTPYFFQ